MKTTGKMTTATKMTGGSADAIEQAYDCLVVGIDRANTLGSTAAIIDEKFGGWLARAAGRGDIKTSMLDAAFLPSPSDAGPAAILVVGIDDPEKIDRELAFRLGSGILRRLCDSQRTQIGIAVSDFVAPDLQPEFVAGAMVGMIGQGLHQATPALKQPAEIVFLGVEQEIVERGRVIGDAVNVARYLVNEPANVIYPASFAEYAESLAKEVGLEVEIWDRDRLEKEGCRAMLAVSQASQHEPRLLMLKYNGGASDEAPVALVGKGVTFDSGGLSLKPTDSMTTMKCDMAGAATVVGVMSAIARLKPKKNVIGFCGLVENMIAGNSYRLGDVIETRSGKTIEIMNTDAEGRVVLADLLDVACDYKPESIVDLATLTGACVVALGTEVCGLFTNKPELLEKIRMAAEIAGEPVWELPMFDFFAEQIRSKVADIKNTGDGRWGGATTAAKFLEEFVRGNDWVHIDIAGPAFADSAKPYRDAGATGVMVRTLVQWIEGDGNRG